MWIGYLGGWQLKYFWNIFHPGPWGNDPIWRAYFSNGLEKTHHQDKLCWFRMFFVGRPLDGPNARCWNYGKRVSWERPLLRTSTLIHFSVLCACGGFLKWWYPTTTGFPAKKWPFWGVLGYHHFRKHPCFVRSLDCWSFQFVFGNLKSGSHCFLSFLEHFVVKCSFPWSKKQDGMMLNKKRLCLVSTFWNTHRINGMIGIFTYLKARNINETHGSAIDLSHWSVIGTKCKIRSSQLPFPAVATT